MTSATRSGQQLIDRIFAAMVAKQMWGWSERNKGE